MRACIWVCGCVGVAAMIFASLREIASLHKYLTLYYVQNFELVLFFVFVSSLNVSAFCLFRCSCFD